MVLAKNCYFFRFVFSVKVVHKIVFKYVLHRKQEFLDYKSFILYGLKLDFSKGLTHGFG